LCQWQGRRRGAGFGGEGSGSDGHFDFSIHVFLMLHPQGYKTRVEIGCPGRRFFEKQKVGRIVKEELGRVGWQRMELQHQRKAEPVKCRITAQIGKGNMPITLTFSDAGFLAGGRQRLEKSAAILIVAQNWLPPITAVQQVIDCTFILDSQLAPHPG